MSAGSDASASPAGTTGMIAWRDRRLLAAMALLLPAVIAAVWLVRPLGVPADLLAVWVAGEFWQMGRTGEIYPAAEGLFTMLPPEGWFAWLAETAGYDGAVYPYLYPPLWAAVMGTLAPADFAPVAEVALWVNAGLLAASTVLAIRATGALLDPLLHVALVLAVFFLTQIAAVGYLQGQPHILVTFLVILAIERSRAGAGTAAGIALALAASLKLFPAAYVVIWLARGERRALIAFALAGAALFAASLLLAGWPLHRAFLDSVAQIGRTLLVIGKSMSFDGLVAELVAAEDMQVVSRPTMLEAGQMNVFWHVAPRPAAWALAANAGLLLVLAGSALAARRMSERALYAGLWPFLLTASVLFTPTGWIYYMLPAAIFAPVLLAGLPRSRGLALFAVGFLLFYAGRLSLFDGPGALPVPEAALYVAGALAWAVGFARVARTQARG